MVSIKVSEESDRPGAKERVEKLREGLVGKITENKSDAKREDIRLLDRGRRHPRGTGPCRAASATPAGMNFLKPRTAVGIQLTRFRAAPDPDPNDPNKRPIHAHIEVLYKITPMKEMKDKPKLLLIDVTVEIRTNLDNDPVATFRDVRGVALNQLDEGVTILLKDRLLQGLVGTAGNVPPK